MNVTVIPGVPITLTLQMGTQTYTLTFTLTLNPAGGVSITADSGSPLQTDTGTAIEEG